MAAPPSGCSCPAPPRSPPTAPITRARRAQRGVGARRRRGPGARRAHWSWRGLERRAWWAPFYLETAVGLTPPVPVHDVGERPPPHGAEVPHGKDRVRADTGRQPQRGL